VLVEKWDKVAISEGLKMDDKWMIRWKRNTRINDCNMNPIGDNLVTTSPIHAHLIFVGISGLGLSVVCVYVYVYIYTYTCIWLKLNIYVNLVDE